jgi:hypothetical protein
MMNDEFCKLLLFKYLQNLLFIIHHYLNYCASVFKATLSALAAQHAALPFAQDFSFATTLFVEADASADADALLFAQHAAVLFAHSAFPVQQAAVLFAQAALSAVQADAVCADAKVANPAKAKSNANFFIVWSDDFF